MVSAFGTLAAKLGGQPFDRIVKTDVRASTFQEIDYMFP
jgi:hypothetical protein